MWYRLLADAVVMVHFGFVLFVVFGGLLVNRHSWAVYLHVPAAVWGAVIEFTGWICPLTPWEQTLRRLGGEAGYDGGFIEHYLLPVLYPPGLTTTAQTVLGLAVVGINAVVYGRLLNRRRRQRSMASRR
jgi:hypothetical protein